MQYWSLLLSKNETRQISRCQFHEAPFSTPLVVHQSTQASVAHKYTKFITFATSTTSKHHRLYLLDCWSLDLFGNDMSWLPCCFSLHWFNGLRCNNSFLGHRCVLCHGCWHHPVPFYPCPHLSLFSHKSLVPLLLLPSPHARDLLSWAFRLRKVLFLAWRYRSCWNMPTICSSGLFIIAWWYVASFVSILSLGLRSWLADYQQWWDSFPSGCRFLDNFSSATLTLYSR